MCLDPVLFVHVWGGEVAMSIDSGHSMLPLMVCTYVPCGHIVSTYIHRCVCAGEWGDSSCMYVCT